MSLPHAPATPASRRAALLLTLACALAACTTPAPPASAPPAPVQAPAHPQRQALAPVAVRLLAINDFHGNLLPPAAFRMPNPDKPGEMLQIPVGGSEALATAVRQLRQDHPNHLFVAAGDLIGASPFLSALFKDEPAIESLSAMGLHLSAVGNHEFDAGKAELLRRQFGGCHPTDGCQGPAPFQGARYKYLAASTIDTATGQPLLPATHVQRFEGVPVGFIGLTLKDTPNLVTPGGVAGLRFEDEVSTINHWAQQLVGQGVQAIVVLIHEGGYPSGGVADCPALSGPIVKIVQQLHPAVDAVVTGHTHRHYNCRLNGKLVTSADQYGSMVTAIDLQLDRRSGDVLTAKADNILVRLDRFGKDPVQTALIAAYQAKAQPVADRVVGQLPSPLPRYPRTPAGASPLGQWIADAHLAATRNPARAGAEIAFMNMGGVRADLPRRPSTPGEAVRLSYGDLFATQPFDNRLVTLTLSGRELLAILKDQWRNQDNERSQLQVSHTLRYRWDASRPGPERLIESSVTIRGEPLVLNRDYRVTVNSFLADGGDGFEGFKAGRERFIGPSDLEALELYLKSNTAHILDNVPRIVREN